MIKKLMGLLAGFFGLVGAMLCIAAIAGIWLFKSSLVGSGLMVLSPVESALGRVEEAMAQSSEMAGTAQDKLRYGDPIPVATAISREINATKTKVSAAYQTVSTFDQFAGSLDAVAQLVSGERLTALTTGVATHLGQFEQSFQQIEGFARSAGEGRTESAGQLSGELSQLQAKAGNVMAEVEKSKGTLKHMATAVPSLIAQGALLLTFLLTCLGLGQLFMLFWGLRAMAAS